MQLNVASGGPAGGQTFEKFDKLVLKKRTLVVRELKADVICPEERGAKRIRNLLSRCFCLSGFATLAAGGFFLGAE